MNKIETALGLMYSMICGGERHSATSVTAYDAAKKELEDLRAEVERLSDELNTEKFRTCERCVQITSDKCAEIALAHFSSNNNIGSYAKGWRDCADAIGVTIKKGFDTWI